MSNAEDRPDGARDVARLAAYYADPARRMPLMRDLFNRSARHYDAVNRLFSLGSGAWYRRFCLRRSGLRPGMQVVDIATGTGLLAREALALTREPRLVIGVDVSEAMLAIAQRNLGIPLIQAAAEALPLAPGIADFVTMGYACAISPICRPPSPRLCAYCARAASMVLLEISAPRNRFLRALASGFIGAVLPRLSRLMHARHPRPRADAISLADDRELHAAGCRPARHAGKRFRARDLQELSRFVSPLHRPQTPKRGVMTVALTAQQQTETLLLSILIQLVVMIGAARLMNLVFRRCGQPGVVGEIVAGLLLGPSLFGHFCPGISAAIFGAKPAPVHRHPVANRAHSADVPDRHELRIRPFARGPGAPRACCPSPRFRFWCRSALGIWLGHLSAPVFAGQIAVPVYALFCGVAMAITAVPILGRILAGYGLVRHELGVLAISAAAINDVAGWLLLAVVVGPRHGHLRARRTRPCSSPAFSALPCICFFVLRPAAAASAANHSRLTTAMFRRP